MDPSVLSRKSGRTFLPNEYLPGHELCFIIHDAMAQLLVSSEKSGVYSATFEFLDEEDRLAFEAAEDVFDWFDRTDRVEEKSEFLRLTVFPALLSDALHFIYEALECSRKAKLNVAYALIRKPIQENLFVLESIAVGLAEFSGKFENSPMLLRAQKAGGIEVHRARLTKIIELLALQDRFDANYLAQLRYDRNVEDSFDGVCNQAMHLFTDHKAIRTENMNMNFIFSGWDSKITQGHFSTVVCRTYLRTCIALLSIYLAASNGQIRSTLKRSTDALQRPQ
jgi:hypothetical protein